MEKYLKRELLNRVKEVEGYNNIPNDFWILGIRSKEDKFNTFDDRFYLFNGNNIVIETTGTTNPGGPQLNNPTNPNGVAVVKSDLWQYDLWQHGKHKGRMDALVQAKPVIYYRDNNRNNNTDEIGKINSGFIGINLHTVTYNLSRKQYIRDYIDSWSAGCQVLNNVGDYNKLLFLIKDQKLFSYCLINEF